MGTWLRHFILVTTAFYLTRCQQNDEFLPVQRARAFAVATNSADAQRSNKPISRLRPLADGNEREIFDEVEGGGGALTSNSVDDKGRDREPDNYDTEIAELNQERPIFIPRIYRNDTDERKAATVGPEIVEPTTTAAGRTLIPDESQPTSATLSPAPSPQPDLTPEPLPIRPPQPVRPIRPPQIIQPVQQLPPRQPIEPQPLAPVRPPAQPEPVQRVVQQPGQPTSSQSHSQESFTSGEASSPPPPPPPRPQQPARQLPPTRTELRPIWMQTPPPPDQSPRIPPSPHLARPMSMAPLTTARPQPAPQPAQPTDQQLPPGIWSQLTQLPPIRQPSIMRPIAPTQPVLQTPARQPFRPPQPMTQIRRPPRPPQNNQGRRLQHDPTGQRTGVCHNTIFYSTSTIQAGGSQPHFTHFAVAVSVDQCARTCHEFNCAVAYFDPATGRCQFVPATAFGVRRDECPVWPAPQYQNNVETDVGIRIYCVTCQRPLRPRPPLSPPRMRRPGPPPQNRVVAVRRPLNRRFEPTVIGMTFMQNSPVRALMMRQPQAVAVSFDLPTPPAEKDRPFHQQLPLKKIQSTSAQGFGGKVLRKGRFRLRGRNEHRILPGSPEPSTERGRRIVDNGSQRAAKLLKTQPVHLTRSSGSVRRYHIAPTLVLSRRPEPLKELDLLPFHH